MWKDKGTSLGLSIVMKRRDKDERLIDIDVKRSGDYQYAMRKGVCKGGDERRGMGVGNIVIFNVKFSYKV